MKKRKKKKKEKVKEKEREKKRKNKNEGECVRVRGEKKKRNDTSLCDLRRTGGRNVLGQETKLVHATRAKRGYQNLRVL